MLTYTLVLPLQFALHCCSAAAHLLMKGACSEAGTLSFTWDRQFAPAAEQEAGSACSEETAKTADKTSPATGAITFFMEAPQLDQHAPVQKNRASTGKVTSQLMRVKQSALHSMAASS